MFIKDFLLLFEGEDTGGGGSADTGDEVIVTSDDNDEVIDDESVDDDTEEQIEEEIEESDEDKPKKKKKDEDEDEDEDLPPVTGSVIKQAAKEFKGLFAKYPELRSSFFFARDVQQFFGSIDEVRQASQTIQNFEEIVREIDSGDPGSIVNYIGNNKDNLYKFGRRFLDSVVSSHPDVFPYITGPYIAQVLKSAARDAKAAGNKNLEASVEHIADYIFAQGGKIPDDPGVTDDSPDPRIQQAQIEHFKNFALEVKDNAINNMNTLVENCLASLQTKKPGMKKMLAREIASSLDALMSKDNNHMARMGRLWSKAKKGILTPALRAEIINAHSDAIKKLLPGVREKVLRENGFKITKGSKQKQTEQFENVDRSQHGGQGRNNDAPGKRDISSMSPAEQLAYFSK